MFFLHPEAFKINKNSGLVMSRRRLQSYERFNLTIVATDKGRPPLWGTTMLHVEVIDINDNRPVFVRPPNGTILHIKEVNPLRGSGAHGMPRLCPGALLPTSGKIESPSPPGMEQDLDLTHGKKVWVMGLDSRYSPSPYVGAGMLRQLWGTETPAARKIRKRPVTAWRACL